MRIAETRSGKERAQRRTRNTRVILLHTFYTECMQQCSVLCLSHQTSLDLESRTMQRSGEERSAEQKRGEQRRGKRRIGENRKDVDKRRDERSGERRK